MTDLIFVPELGLLGTGQRRGRSVASRSVRTRPRPNTIPATPESFYFQPMLIPHPPQSYKPPMALTMHKSTTPKAHYMKEYLKRYAGLVRQFAKGKSLLKTAPSPIPLRATSTGMKSRARRKLTKDRRLTDDDFRSSRDDSSFSFRPKTAPIDIQETLRIYGARSHAT